MLRLTNNQHQLDIESHYGRAWIEHYPKLSENLERLGEIPDWRLWVEVPGKPASLSKSPTRLLIESQLRSWVLRQSKRCLATLTFAELTRLAQGLSVPAAPRVYHGRDESHARWTEKLARHRAALKEHIFDPQKWHD